MQTDDRQIDRRVQNELLFRAVNEKLRGLNAEFEAFSDDQALFVCECSRIDCIAQVELAVGVRRDLRPAAPLSRATRA